MFDERVDTGQRGVPTKHGQAPRRAVNALDERLDDIEYTGELLDGQLEHAELVSRVYAWAAQRTHSLIGCTRDWAQLTQ